jgi:hypothetical protein
MSPCSVVRLPGGGVAIVKHAKRRGPKCRFCNRSSEALCDAIVGGTLGGDPITCDTPICRMCARHVEPDKDYCPKHQTGGV